MSYLHEPGAAGTDTFTVVMPLILRERFDRWLMRNHLQMRRQSPDGEPRLYVVAPPAKYGYPTITPPRPGDHP